MGFTVRPSLLLWLALAGCPAPEDDGSGTTGSSSRGTGNSADAGSDDTITSGADTSDGDERDDRDDRDDGDDPYGSCPCGDELCTGLGESQTCTVPCGPDMTCPGEGTCVVQLEPGPPTHCAIECDPDAPACPSGMTCVDLDDDPAVVADGICGWPTG